MGGSGMGAAPFEEALVGWGKGTWLCGAGVAVMSRLGSGNINQIS